MMGSPLSMLPYDTTIMNLSIPSRIKMSIFLLLSSFKIYCAFFSQPNSALKFQGLAKSKLGT